MSAAARAICAHWEVLLEHIHFPEDEIPVPDHPVDAIVSTDGGHIALEHTLHQSFPKQLAQSTWFRPLHQVCQQLSGLLPGPGRYELSVSAAALQGQTKLDLDLLTRWIRSTAVFLTPGRSAYGATNVARAEPPDVPIAVSLLRTEQWQGVPDGTLMLRWLIDFDLLPAARVDQMVTTLSRKLPKLERHRPTGGRTVLLLENQDIQLVNADLVTESIVSALETLALPQPDAIVMANVLGETSGLSWLKDRDDWHPQLSNLYWVPMELI